MNTKSVLLILYITALLAGCKGVVKTNTAIPNGLEAPAEKKQLFFKANIVKKRRNPKSTYIVQVSAFLTLKHAVAFNTKYATLLKGHSSILPYFEKKSNLTWYIVSLGKFSSLKKAKKTAHIYESNIKTRLLIRKLETNQLISIYAQNVPENEKLSYKKLFLNYTKKHVFSFQLIGLYKKQEAIRWQTLLSNKGYNTVLSPIRLYASPSKWYSVHIGFFQSKQQAAKASNLFSQKENLMTTIKI